MKFNFKIQECQTDAVDSVVNCFKGQPYIDNVSYRRDIGNKREMQTYSQMSFVNNYEQETLDFTDDFDDSGFKNDNFYKKEFQTLWGYINHKYAYTVSFDSNELIKKAIDAEL